MGGAPTLYVASIDGLVSVQAISTVTNQAGKPIRTGDYNSGVTEAVTPDGKTTATNKAERPIGGIHSGADALVIAP